MASRRRTPSASKRSASDDSDKTKHAKPPSCSRPDRADTSTRPRCKCFDISELFSADGGAKNSASDDKYASLSGRHSCHVETKCSSMGHGRSMRSSTGSELTKTSSNKRRIKWTSDLHDKFVECVNQLGGPTKATPKAILELMEVDELSIFHVKSHLQALKYRSVSVQARDHVQVNIDEGYIHHNDSWIKELMRLQDGVIEHLQEHLQIQTSLQLMVEEQNKLFQQIIDHSSRSKR
ncbi:PREDICTED: myb family transcription factor PHL5-like isoform X2 [Tarenaya hassleriana]|uniref:myb family transcription factor PHL5-like isoform X2 n=1 Tax=Tarenaya hassleriana TaxID=28532 RepID=UPI00053C6701|nr:PREDICTED: myb family transcription factor PHL5-like isoform X2 [Tarenaya hassleriana]